MVRLQSDVGRWGGIRGVIPAASLKRRALVVALGDVERIRGVIPAASLKRHGERVLPAAARGVHPRGYSVTGCSIGFRQ